MKLTSPQFEEGQPIPPLYTQDGDNISPPLQWEGAPFETESFALIVEDPDAPSGLFTHWLIYNIPPAMRGLDREVPEGSHYGGEALQGKNQAGKIGYIGPKPPSGEHRYIFRLFALDRMLDLPPGVEKADLLQAMEGHILAESDLTGFYALHDPLEISGELRAERQEEDAYDRAVHQEN